MRHSRKLWRRQFQRRPRYRGSCSNKCLASPQLRCEHRSRDGFMAAAFMKLNIIDGWMARSFNRSGAMCSEEMLPESTWTLCRHNYSGTLIAMRIPSPLAESSLGHFSRAADLRNSSRE